MAKKKESKPVRVQGYTFGEMLQHAAERAENAPPQTPEQVAEIERLIAELNGINKELGEPPLMCLRITRRKL